MLTINALELLTLGVCDLINDFYVNHKQALPIIM